MSETPTIKGKNGKCEHDWVKYHIWGVRFIESNSDGVVNEGENYEGADYECSKCKKRKTLPIKD